MDKDMMEMFQTIMTGMQDMETRINKRLDAIDLRIDTEVRGLKIMVENDVTKRLDSLVDGYRLVHEKQWETDQKVRELEKRLERLESLAG